MALAQQGDKKIIKSISYNQEEIIQDILSLYVDNEQIDVDVTYSKGNFYKGTGIKEPLFKLDTNPRYDDVMCCDCRETPFENSSIKSIMFDPPFLATKGRSLGKEDKSNVIVKRFGNYKNEKELHRFYIDSLKEFWRILKDDGVLIFKCQDKVSSGKQYMSHVFICNEAVKQGFYPVDLFILCAENRIYADWQIKNQKHARKYHSYFWVFKKNNKKIEYV